MTTTVVRNGRIRKPFWALPIFTILKTFKYFGMAGIILLSLPVKAEWENANQKPASDHFDGTRFFNQEPGHTFGDMIKWLWEMKTVAWPRWINDLPQPRPPRRVGIGELRVTLINQATILIQTDGLNILTDPIWSMRAGFLTWVGPKRVRSPGISMESLPPINLVLLSHDHYDHLDLPTLKRLEARDHPLIFTGLGVKRHLNPKTFKRVLEMDWWQEQTYGASGLKVTFVPALHQSGRSLFRNNRTLWGGFVIQGKAGRVYFAGDTGYGSFLNDLKNRFDGFRLTIFPIGSYEKRWFMKNQHMNPDDAVKAHLLLNSQQSMGMHYATFLEHPEQAIDAHEKDLGQALDRHGVHPKLFWVLKFGEGTDVSRRIVFK